MMSEVAAWQPGIKYMLLESLYPNINPYGDIKFHDASTIDQSTPKSRYNDSPFTQADLLSTQDDQVQSLIYQIRKSNIISNNERLATDLYTLFNITKEENPASLGISVDSLSNFYDFLQLYTNLVNPILSLSPDYNIYASWRSKKKIFSVHFLPKGGTHFVHFRPNKRQPEHKIRITGTCTIDSLFDIIEPSSLIGWVFNEG
ncbi:hypothetical protein JW935_19675 [candidate division KSB1 bacterium]|nr:hypothetical protein [candidate division KSB1 bacterium]